MANEVEAPVGEVEAPQGGAGEVEAAGGQPDAGAATPAIDPQEFEQYKTSHQFWSRVEQIANSNPEFRTVLEKAWKNEPFKLAQEAAAQKAAPAPRQRNEADDRLKTLQEKVERFEQYQQSQQQEQLKREKFAEVQTETEAAFKKFNATDGDQKEFWTRYGNMIRTEASQAIQNNPSLPPHVAMQMAYSRHSSNIAGEYALLMDDRMVDFYGKRLQERSNPLRGIASPADKAGKDGTWPTTQERFFSAIKNERDSTKRAEMYAAYAKEKGIPIGDLFRSSGG